MSDSSKRVLRTSGMMVILLLSWAALCAGASLPTQATLDTQIHHLQREAMTGGYEAAADAAERNEQVYSSIASLIAWRVASVSLRRACSHVHGFWSCS